MLLVRLGVWVVQVDVTRLRQGLPSATCVLLVDTLSTRLVAMYVQKGDTGMLVEPPMHLGVWVVQAGVTRLRQGLLSATCVLLVSTLSTRLVAMRAQKGNTGTHSHNSQSMQ